MNQADIAALMEGVAPVMRGFVEASFRPLAERLAALEKRIDGDLPALIELRHELEKGAGEMMDGVPGMIEKLVDAAISGEGARITTIVKGEVDALRADDEAAMRHVAREEATRALAELPKPKDGVDGKDGPAGPVGERGERGEPGAAGAPGADGKSLTADDVAPLVETLVAAAFATVRVPKDGEPGRDGKDGADGKNGANGVDGKSVTIGDLVPLVDEVVSRKVAEIPRPADGKEGRDGKDGAKGVDGKSVTIEEIAPLVDEAVTRKVAEIPRPADGKDGRDGKDGVGLAGAIINHDGELVVTMTDGSTHKLGHVIGKDGAPGRDGLGFDDLDIVHDGARGFTFKLMRGDVVKEFPFTLPVVLDCGVFKDGTDYAPGDGVSFGGSFWIARAATKDRPGTSDAWRLAVKKGRDGKDGEAPKPPAKVKLA